LKKILIIDDDRELILEMEEILTEEGFLIEKTHDPVEGRNMLLNGEYDIVLLDYKMPGINGIDFLMSIKPCAAKCAIILITGSLNMEQLLEESGCAPLVRNIVTKPFDIEQLIATLKGI
jgi:DNA-binding response OmpR family regulator